MKKIITDYDLVQADEITIQVMNEKDRENTAKSYMWCYRGGDKNNLSIVYDYQETRGGYHAGRFLSGFKGFLQTDAYPGYNFADRSTQITSVGSHAHARRPFAELAKISTEPGLANQALSFYRKLYAVEDEVLVKTIYHLKSDWHYAYKNQNLFWMHLNTGWIIISPPLARQDRKSHSPLFIQLG